MRSLTCSSAGIPAPFPSTAAPGWSTHASTYSYQPTSATTIHNSGTNPLTVPEQAFFNLHNDTLLLSSQAKGNVTRAIQGGWASTTLKLALLNSIFGFVTQNGSQRTYGFQQMNLCSAPSQPLVSVGTQAAPPIADFQLSRHGTLLIMSNGKAVPAFVTCLRECIILLPFLLGRPLVLLSQGACSSNS